MSNKTIVEFAEKNGLSLSLRERGNSCMLYRRLDSPDGRGIESNYPGSKIAIALDPCCIMKHVDGDWIAGFLDHTGQPMEVKGSLDFILQVIHDVYDTYDPKSGIHFSRHCTRFFQSNTQLFVTRYRFDEWDKDASL
jgi:hypothetical protein